MENSSKLNFNSILKIILIIYLGYFLILLTFFVTSYKNGSEIGRYENNAAIDFIFDTKTGTFSEKKMKSE